MVKLLYVFDQIRCRSFSVNVLDRDRERELVSEEHPFDNSMVSLTAIMSDKLSLSSSLWHAHCAYVCVSPLRLFVTRTSFPLNIGGCVTIILGFRESHEQLHINRILQRHENAFALGSVLITSPLPGPHCVARGKRVKLNENLYLVDCFKDGTGIVVYLVSFVLILPTL